MKKLFVAMLTVLMLGSLCFGTFTALAQESEPEGGSKEYNLIDFENTDFGEHSYNAETGELTLAGTGTVSYLTTLLDSITDGKLVLKDGTAKDFSELTFVMRATISAKSLGGWQVPYIVFAKNDEATLQYHFRNTINNQYIFKNVGTAETVLQECGVGYVADESPYQMLIKKTGDTLFAQTIALPLANGGTITLEDKDMIPCFGVSAREVAGTVIKDMKMYVAPDQEQQDTYVELGAYAKSIGVKTAPAAVEQGEDLKDCTFTLNMLDGTTQELTLDDVTISGFDKNSAGEQTVTVSADVLNSSVSTTFEIEVEAAEEPGTDPDEPGDTDEIESYRVSLNKTEYAFGEEFDISTVVVTAVYESGKTEAVTVADGDLSVSGYDKEKAGEQSVVITYKGTEYTLSVTVAESGGGETGGCSGTVLGAGSAIAAVAACLFAGIVLKKRANKNRV